MPLPVKPGMKTSEWWFSIASVALMNVAAKFVPAIEAEAEAAVMKIPAEVWAIGGTAIVTSCYAIARGIAKGFENRQ